MHGAKNEDRYTYWKRPWHKWIILAAAVIQLLCLWMDIRKYRDISAAGVLSLSEWERFSAQQLFLCALNGLMAVCFLGIVSIGVLARSQKAARLAEGIFLLLLAAAWGAAGPALHLFSSNGKGIFWTFIWILMVGGAVFDLL